jgi:hypothetical protein
MFTRTLKNQKNPTGVRDHALWRTEYTDHVSARYGISEDARSRTTSMKRASGVRDEIRGFRMGLRVRLQTRSFLQKIQNQN